MQTLTFYEKVLREIVLATSSRAELLQAVQHNPDSPYRDQHDHPVTDHIDAVRRNVAEVATIIDGILQSDLTREQREQMEKYMAERTKYVDEGLNAACDAILAGRYKTANQILLTKTIPLCERTVHEAERFGNTGIAEQTLCTLSLIFGGGLAAFTLWMLHALSA